MIFSLKLKEQREGKPLISIGKLYFFDSDIQFLIIFPLLSIIFQDLIVFMA